MIPFQGEVAGGLEIDREELHFVPSLELAQLPKIRLDHRHRADKPAEARAVGTENYRHVTGEIHRPNGVRIVMDIRRMQTRFATIGTHPFRLRPDQPHTGSAGVEMHFPLGGEEGADVVFGEVFRCAMRAVDHPDLPQSGQLGDLFFSQLLTGAVVAQGRDMQHVAGSQRTTAMPTKLAKGEGTFAAQIIRNLKAATQAQIAASAGSGNRTKAQSSPRRYQQSCVHRHHFTIKGQWNHCPGHRHHRIAIEAQQRPAHGDFQRSGAFVVTQQKIAQTQRATVHRP